MKVIDTFLFFNEIELLLLRLEILYEYIDLFIIVEYDTTFSGKSKKYNLLDNLEKFEKYSDKIKYFKLTDTIVSKDYDDRKTNFKKIYHHKHMGNFTADSLYHAFKREINQRDGIIIGLRDWAKDNDVILINDLDEIPNPYVLEGRINQVKNSSHINFEMDWFLYNFETMKNRKWYGTRICKYSYLFDKSIDLVRYSTEVRGAQIGEIVANAGWHFSSFGGSSIIKEKMNAYNYQGKKNRYFLRMLDFLMPYRISNAVNKKIDILDSGAKLKRVDIAKYFPLEIYKKIKNSNLSNVKD